MTEHKSLQNRTRNYLVAVCLALFAASLVLTTGCSATNEPYLLATAPLNTPFKMPDIKPPTFPDRTIDIRDHGAVGDGTTMNTKAIASAIAACAKAGGGRVLVPAGTWLTGAIHLKSNINLQIEKGAELRFSTDHQDYLPVVFTRWAGIECYNYSPFIYARDCTNVAITGSGYINGQGKAWWHWQKREKSAKLSDAAYNGVPVEERVFGTEEDALRPQMIQLVNCKNVLLKDYTSRNSPFWNNHLVYCEHVIVRNLTLLNPEHGPNSDGINIDSCRYVHINGIYADVGDDAICLKAGMNEDGWRVGRPTENVVIENCRVKKAHGGFVIGSDMSGGVRNIFVQDCHYDGTDIGIRIKSRRGRGGSVENIWVQDITMGQVKYDAIRLNMFYSSFGPSRSKKPPTFRNIHIRNVTCRQAKGSVQLFGLPERNIENITLENISISAEKGLFCTDAKDIKLVNVKITTEQGPVMLLKDSQDVTVRKSTCPKDTGTFLKLEGGKTKNIRLSDNNLSNAQKDVVLGEDVQPDAVVRE